MVIDSSALLAILNDEPERRTFNEAIQTAETRVMSAATLVEVSIVIETRFGAQGLTSRAAHCQPARKRRVLDQKTCGKLD